MIDEATEVDDAVIGRALRRSVLAAIVLCLTVGVGYAAIRWVHQPAAIVPLAV